MGFIKKLFYKTVETTELEKNEDQDTDKEPNPFLVDFPEDTDESQNESNPFLEELNEKSKSVEYVEKAQDEIPDITTENNNKNEIHSNGGKNKEYH